MIGSYSRSQANSGRDVPRLPPQVFAAQSGDTYCSGCSVKVMHVAINGSIAVSYTGGKVALRFARVAVFARDYIIFVIPLSLNLACRSARLFRNVCTSIAAMAVALCSRLMMAAQVYGGSMSFVVGAYLWSTNSGFVNSRAGGTVVIGLSMVFNNSSISDSLVATLTFGGAFQAPNHPIHMRILANVLFTQFERRFFTGR